MAHFPSPRELSLIAVDRRPIVFLDIDGVLNNQTHWEKLPPLKGHPSFFKIDPRNVAALSRLIDTVLPVVVLSSTWRHTIHYKALRDALVKDCGLTSEALFTSETPFLNDSARGQDILGWMDNLVVASRQDDTVPTLTLAQVTSRSVILDDIRTMTPLQSRHIWIDEYDGLTDATVDAAIALLQP